MNIKYGIAVITTLVSLSSLSADVFAQDHAAHGGHAKAATTSTADTKASEKKLEMVEGLVRKIDMDAKKITLKHGEIKSLDMTAMTMVFQVKDTKQLEGLKAGDKVKFTVEQTKSGYMVSSIEVAK